jgi:hypothetical protein
LDILLKRCTDWGIVGNVSENVAATFFRVLQEVQPEDGGKNYL